MENNQQGFVKLLLVLAIVAGGLFFFKAEDGQSYGKKIIASAENFINGILGKAYEARDSMQTHQDELQKGLEEN